MAQTPYERLCVKEDGESWKLWANHTNSVTSQTSNGWVLVRGKLADGSSNTSPMKLLNIGERYKANDGYTYWYDDTKDGVVHVAVKFNGTVKYLANKRKKTEKVIAISLAITGENPNQAAGISIFQQNGIIRMRAATSRSGYGFSYDIKKVPYFSVILDYTSTEEIDITNAYIRVHVPRTLNDPYGNFVPFLLADAKSATVGTKQVKAGSTTYKIPVEVITGYGLPAVNNDTLSFTNYLNASAPYLSPEIKYPTAWGETGWKMSGNVDMKTKDGMTGTIRIEEIPVVKYSGNSFNYKNPNLATSSAGIYDFLVGRYGTDTNLASTPLVTHGSSPSVMSKNDITFN